MKLIFLQLSRKMLSLTPVKTGGRTVFGAPKNFELPQNLTAVGVFSDLPAFAKFVKLCANSVGLSTKNYIICLEDDSVVCKEYQHLPCKPKDLLSFARLEAESVLSDSVDDYLIRNCEYGHANELSGKLTGALFAVRGDLVGGIRRAFSREGLKAIKIAPPMGGLIHAAKTFLNTDRGTAAVLDLSFEKTRLLVMHNGSPIFQRTFEGIFDDIVDIIRTDRSVSFSEATQAALGLSFQEGGAFAPSAEAVRQITTLLDASANEAVRNLRMVLSSERLELNRIILCGPLAALPNYSEFWDSLGLDVPLDAIGTAAIPGSLPEAEPPALRAGFNSGSFFTFTGLLRAKKADDLDFMNLIRRQSGSAAAQIGVLAVLTIIALGVMGLEPLLCTMKAQQLLQDKKALSGSAYSEIQDLQNKQASLSSELDKAKADRALLPYGKSNSQEIMQKILEQVTAKAVSVNSCTVDNISGRTAVVFIASNYDSYLEIKHGVEKNGYFTVAVPFSAVIQANGAYECSVTLIPKRFTAWKSGEKGGAAK